MSNKTTYQINWGHLSYNSITFLWKDNKDIVYVTQSIGHSSVHRTVLRTILTRKCNYWPINAKIYNNLLPFFSLNQTFSCIFYFYENMQETPWGYSKR